MKKIRVWVLMIAAFTPTVAGEDPPELREEVLVVAHAPNQAVARVDLDLVESGEATNLALALESIPGIAGVRRSQNAFEPVVRGLGWERIQTEVNGVPLYGACPGRMDPPATTFPATAVRHVAVVRGLSSVTLGAGGTGGRLEISTDHDRGYEAATEMIPYARLSHDAARDGITGSAGIAGGTERLDFSAGLEVVEENDYRSADGTLVPAGDSSVGGHLSFGHRPDDYRRWYANVVTQDAEEIDYPAMPMNADFLETRVYTAGYSQRFRGGGMGPMSVDFSVGLGDVDHGMSNRGKPSRDITENETLSESRSHTARVESDWLVTPRSILKAGAGFSRLNRDALRERRPLATGVASYDHLWPDVRQDDLGLYAEYGWVPATDWHLRIGARYDRVESEARAADDPGIGGRTVRESYVRFYGAEAADTDRSEDLLTGNVLLSRRLSPRWTLQAGAGVAARAASITERYLVFAAFPKGFAVGNPTLDAERKRELSAGAVFEAERVGGSLSVYHYAIDDFILETRLPDQDVSGDGRPDRLFGFVNEDAVLYGVEVAAVLRPTERISLPLALAHVRGEQRATDAPLPYIPALEGRLAARYTVDARYLGWFEIGGRFVDGQDRFDPSLLENATPGYAVWHLRGSLSITDYAELRVGVENLFDKQYHDHLTPTVPLPVGGLQKGDEIPQPERSLFVSMRLEF
ncbi:MAG: TonB-dependent receptor [bacterium]|nr:TonB-dependent receptor [bacterium]